MKEIFRAVRSIVWEAFSGEIIFVIQMQMEIAAFLFPISGVVCLPPFSGGQPEALERLERHRALI